MQHSILDELAWRGLLYQHTEGLPQALSRGRVSAYAGFDPTAPSLHVGNLVPVMGLVHVQRAGHRPIPVVGGGTGLIGDPSGKATERQLSATEAVQANARAIHAQLERFLDFTGPSGAVMRNNADWLLQLGAIEFLRDVGKHFTVNYMTAKESVKSRLEGGISYTEFSYMLLQAYDYLQLFRRDNVTVQIGGSDQWGNITAGIELIRRVDGAEAHALTMPLVTTASGAKFGKTEAGTVWLDPARTSPYRFYQYWYNTDDRDTGRFLRFFTLKSRSEIESLERALEEHPETREAQQALAREVTARVHGEHEEKVARELSELLFGGADPRRISAEALHALRVEVPFAEVDAPSPQDGSPATLDVVEMLAATGLVTSKGAARRLVQQGGAYVNGRRIEASDSRIMESELLAERHVLLRKGAREYALVRVR